MLLTRTKRRYSRAIQIGVTLVTMLLIGVWHGAAWTFVAWGAWHGLLLVLNQQFGRKPGARWAKLAMGLVTFHLVGIGWVLFASESFQAAGRFYLGMLRSPGPLALGFYLQPVLLAGTLLFAIDLAAAGVVRLPARARPAFNAIAVVAACVLLVCLALIVQAHGGDARPFIYGQF